VAWAVGATYIASGSLVSADLQLGVYVALALMPWVLAGIDRCIDGYSWRSFGFGSGLIGCAGTTLLWSAYPGIWLMAPVYLAPYVAIRLCISKSVRYSLRGILAIIFGSALSVIGWTPILSETISFSIFGDKWRINSDPNLGLLDGWALVGYFVANPGYFKHSPSTTNPPVYIGLTLILIFLYALICVINIIFHRIKTEIFNIILFFLQLYGILTENYYISPLILLILSIYYIPNTFLLTLTIKHMLISIVIIIIYLLLIPSNIMNSIRLEIFPFSLVRWQHYNIYIINLLIITNSYSILEHNIYLINIKKYKEFTFEYFKKSYVFFILFILGLCVILINLANAISDGLGPQIDWHQAGFAISPFVWTVVILFLLYIYIIHHSKSITLISILYNKMSIFCIFFFILIKIYSSATDDLQARKWWTYFATQNSFIIILFDVLNIIIIIRILCIIISQYKFRKLLYILILLNTFDVSIASIRYYSELEIMWNNTFTILINKEIISSARSSILAREGIIELATTTPHMWQFPGAMPNVARIDSDWGTPSLFSRFAQFPRKWEIDGGDHLDVVVRAEDLRSTIGGDLESFSRGSCPESSSQSNVDIRRFVSSTIEATVTSQCDGLLVWTDSWAPGWAVYVNDELVQGLRVNRAVRGVMLPSGITELKWSYRPPLFIYLILAMGVGITTSIVLVIRGIMGQKKIYIKI